MRQGKRATNAKRTGFVDAHYSGHSEWKCGGCCVAAAACAASRASTWQPCSLGAAGLHPCLHRPDQRQTCGHRRTEESCQSVSEYGSAAPSGETRKRSSLAGREGARGGALACMHAACTSGIDGTRSATLCNTHLSQCAKQLSLVAGAHAQCVHINWLNAQQRFHVIEPVFFQRITADRKDSKSEYRRETRHHTHTHTPTRHTPEPQHAPVLQQPMPCKEASKTELAAE